MSSFVGVLCLLLCASWTEAIEDGTYDRNLQQLSKLLHATSPRNETANIEIKRQIRVLLKQIDSSESEEDTSLNNSKRILARINLCRKALLYIKDNIRMADGDEECAICVKEPDTTKLTELFDDLGPEVWGKIDMLISELLVDAATSLKALKEGGDADAYRKKIYCNAERMNLSSEEVSEDDTINIDSLLTNITNLLDSVDPKNNTINLSISHMISDSLKALNPMICEDAFVPADYSRTLKKVLLCKKALLYLRNNATKAGKRVDCEDCAKYPDTRPLLFLLYDFTPEIAGKMNDFIGKFLVDVAVNLKNLAEGDKYEEYKTQLDFNINRLNLIW